MAVLNWLGRARAIAEVVTIQVTAYDAATTYKFKLNGKYITTIAAGSANATATALAAAWNASTDTELAAITASANTDTVTLTADTAGVPFVADLSKSVSGGAGTLGSITTSTAATGPNHFGNVDNWDTGAAPANGDTVNINLSLSSVLYELDQSAVTVASLNIFTTSFTQNTLGLPVLNASGYSEYLEQYLKIGATACVIDADSPRVKLNFGSVANATEVRRTGQANDPPTPAVLIKGTNVANTLDVVSGNVGAAYYEGESYTATTVTCGQNGNYIGGTGAVVTDTVSVGQSVFKGTGTNWQTDGGTSEILGTPGFSTLTCSGGQLLAKFSGTIVDVTVGPGTIDASQDNTDRTFTNCTLVAGGVINDPNETITYTNGITLEAGVSSLQAA